MKILNSCAVIDVRCGFALSVLTYQDLDINSCQVSEELTQHGIADSANYQQKLQLWKTRTLKTDAKNIQRN